MSRAPVTAAVRALRAAGVAYSEHLYRYEERGGTRHSALELGVDEHEVVKTIVLEDEERHPLLVLMHGDLEVSTKGLARVLSRRTIVPCRPEVAERHTGYKVGGTSPFGTRKSIPVYLERSILELPKIYLNGGLRGFLVGIDPREVARVLGATSVDVGIAG